MGPPSIASFLVKAGFCFSVLFSTKSFSEEVCFPNGGEKRWSWAGKMRVKALKNVDQFLNWSIRDQLRTYVLEAPKQGVVFDIDVPLLWEFGKRYGYFSMNTPLVSSVNGHRGSKEIVFCLLGSLGEKINDVRFLEFATGEILAKVLAYRTLRRGDEVKISTMRGEEVVLATYQLDEIFNLWKGMPAFGLIPKEEGPAILLFRGTDFSLDSRAGWASLMSDLDISGPGLKTFRKAQPELHAWLEKVANMEKKAKVIGYSLGGALATYTFIYEHALLSEKGSIAFNSPGVSDQVYRDWDLLPEERKEGISFYVNQGDLVSKMGKLMGRVYALSLPIPMKPVFAHTILLSAQNCFFQERVDVSKENAGR